MGMASSDSACRVRQGSRAKLPDEWRQAGGGESSGQFPRTRWVNDQRPLVQPAHHEIGDVCERTDLLQHFGGLDLQQGEVPMHDWGVTHSTTSML